MLKKILSVMLGLAAGVVTIFVMQSISYVMFPPPAGLNLNDPDVLKEYVKNVPFGAMLALIIGYAIGAFAGGFTARLVYKSGGKGIPLIIGALLTIAGVMNMVMIPHPFWFWIVSLMVFIPSAIAGHGILKTRDMKV